MDNERQGTRTRSGTMTVPRPVGSAYSTRAGKPEPLPKSGSGRGRPGLFLAGLMTRQARAASTRTCSDEGMLDFGIPGVNRLRIDPHLDDAEFVTQRIVGRDRTRQTAIRSGLLEVAGAPVSTPARDA